MKTTFVITQPSLNTLKPKIRTSDEVFVDYFRDRKDLVRWFKESPDNNLKNNFFRLTGLIDISYYTTAQIDADQARSLIMRKDVEFLVHRNFVGVVTINNKDGRVYRVRAEDVQKNEIVFEELHLIYDEELKEDFYHLVPYLDYYLGNTYDYICQVRNLKHVTNRGLK